MNALELSRQRPCRKCKRPLADHCLIPTDGLLEPVGPICGGILPILDGYVWNQNLLRRAESDLERRDQQLAACVRRIVELERRLDQILDETRPRELPSDDIDDNHDA